MGSPKTHEWTIYPYLLDREQLDDVIGSNDDALRARVERRARQLGTDKIRSLALPFSEVLDEIFGGDVERDHELEYRLALVPLIDVLGERFRFDYSRQRKNLRELTCTFDPELVWDILTAAGMRVFAKAWLGNKPLWPFRTYRPPRVVWPITAILDHATLAAATEQAEETAAMDPEELDFAIGDKLDMGPWEAVVHTEWVWGICELLFRARELARPARRALAVVVE